MTIIELLLLITLIIGILILTYYIFKKEKEIKTFSKQNATKINIIYTTLLTIGLMIPVSMKWIFIEAQNLFFIVILIIIGMILSIIFMKSKNRRYKP